MKQRFLFLVLALACVFAAAAGRSGAEEGFPKKPISIICPFKAGGGADMILRPFEAVSKKYIGQPVVVVYKEGAGGVIGIAELKKSRPDGYTMAIAMSGPMATQPALTTVPYDPTKDFDYVGGIAFDPIAIGVSGKAPYKTLAEFIEAAKKGDFTWSTAAPGSVGHLAAELFLSKNGIKARQIPSSGGNEAVINLLGGHIDFVSVHPSELQSGYLSGDIRVLGVMSEKRREQIPDVPTFKELGYDMVEGVQRSFVLPRGVPQDVQKALNDLLQKVLKDEDFLKAMKTASIEVEYLTPDEAKKRYIDDFVKFSKVVKDIGLR